MRRNATISVIIPALNEERSIGNVLRDIPEWVDEIIVADNGSTDATRDAAESAGAKVVTENRKGYGSACLKGMANLSGPDIVVFLDADYSDHPDQMDRLVDPIIDNAADLVIGSRALGQAERGALSIQARFGNWLACRLMRLFWSVRFTDLGPFRAVRYATLRRLGMRDPDYGWTVEMQLKAVRQGVRVAERPVDYRRRIGRSKVSGTVRGVIGAGYKILSTIVLTAIAPRLIGADQEQAVERLIVFTRYPKPGAAKTRLASALGDEGAAAVHKAMTEYVVDTAIQSSQRHGISVEVRYAGADVEAMRRWLGDHIFIKDQGGGGLGERLVRAFKGAFQEGMERAIVIGSDCPSVTPSILQQAFNALDDHDVVVGPATDGGYYLIGMTSGASIRALPRLFQGPKWGTETVFDETLTIAAELEVSVYRLEPLSDVDRPEDLPLWGAIEEQAGPAISVIIPALNEESYLADTLASVKGRHNVELIVVDGASQDGTAALASRWGATVVRTAPNRATQMNAGAAHSTGELLLFLHADTRLPAGFGKLIRDTLDDPAIAVGAFQFKTDHTGRTLRFFERVAAVRGRFLRMPYGDQAFFMRRETFHQLGGFEEISIMEDFEFIRRARKLGRIEIVSAPATTSARRWKRLGPWRTWLRNQWAIAAYYAGISPERIARAYRKREK